VPIADGRPDPAGVTSIAAPRHIFELSWVEADDARRGQPVEPE
jgi:hypothetical protein